ncbi:MAG TPA: TetR/AcrR family transcriptional regulator [Deltaproteobacteria bacterium]|nr:TetR/AcrR family transcriptional regulator [Deltaproteobacteria bacterium]
MSDVAATAEVGKGRLYLYFKHKDDLHLSLLYRSFSRIAWIASMNGSKPMRPWGTRGREGRECSANSSSLLQEIQTCSNSCALCPTSWPEDKIGERNTGS